MAFLNMPAKEILVKVVYYGPGLGGKTTCLQYIYQSLPQKNRGKLISLASDEDRTIFFDFLPAFLGVLKGYSVRLQLYTVPGQVRYNQTRRLVLEGVDGIIFVADLQSERRTANLELYRNLEENLHSYGLQLASIPHVIQYNKIDLPNIDNPKELNQLLNKYDAPYFLSCALTGEGVLEALTEVSRLIFDRLREQRLPEPEPQVTPMVPVRRGHEAVEEMMHLKVPSTRPGATPKTQEIPEVVEADDLHLIEPEPPEPGPSPAATVSEPPPAATEADTAWAAPAPEPDTEPVDAAAETVMAPGGHRSLQFDELEPEDIMNALDAALQAPGPDRETRDNGPAVDVAVPPPEPLPQVPEPDPAGAVEAGTSWAELAVQCPGSGAWWWAGVHPDWIRYWKDIFYAWDNQDLTAFVLALEAFETAYTEDTGTSLPEQLPEALRTFWQLAKKALRRADTWSERTARLVWYLTWCMGWLMWQKWTEELLP